MLPTGVLAAALIPWALGGHTTQAGQDIAASSLIVHVLAAGAWIGGLAIMVLHVRGDLLTTVLPRFSTLALWCWVVDRCLRGDHRLAAGRPGRPTCGPATTAGCCWSSCCAWACSARSVPGTGAGSRPGCEPVPIGQRGALLRVAAVEVLVMGATMGVATALSATAPPVGHAAGHESAHGTSRIEAHGRARVPVISAENLVLLWRPDVIVLLLVAVAWPATWSVSAGCGRPAGWPVGRICWAVGAQPSARCSP